MPRYLVTVTALVEMLAEQVIEVEADDETGAKAEAESQAEASAHCSWSVCTPPDYPEPRDGTITATECELVEGTDDE